MSSFFTDSDQRVPTVSKSQIPTELAIKNIIATIDTNKFVALYQDNILCDEFFESLKGAGTYIIEDCTDIRSKDFISQITKLIARYHEDKSEEIAKIAHEYRHQGWVLNDKDSKMRDCFIRECLAMCHLGKYLLLVHPDVLEYISDDDLLILNELKKHTNCRIAIFISEIEIFNKYRYRIPVIKFINMDKQNEPLVYISHHWDDESNMYVNGLRSALDLEGIRYGIDKKDAKYHTKLTDFEEEIGAGYIVVPIINGGYLQSIECMYELALTSENGHIEDRLFPLIIVNIKRNGEGLKEQIDYWKAKDIEFRERVQQLGVGRANIDNDEVVRIDKICRQLPTIWEYFKKHLTSTKEELLANNYALMIRGIKKRLALLGNDPNSPIPSPILTGNTPTPTVMQTGDHAVNITNVGGNITINQ